MRGCIGLFKRSDAADSAASFFCSVGDRRIEATLDTGNGDGLRIPIDFRVVAAKPAVNVEWLLVPVGQGEELPPESDRW